MAWIILISSGLFEAVWATALSKSEGLSKLLPSLIFFVTCAISMFGLAWALRELPVGSAYAVWTGVGACVTALYAMATKAEPVSLLRIFFIAGIIACIAGLKLTSGEHNFIES